MDFEPENPPDQARKGVPYDRDDMTVRPSDINGPVEKGAFSDARHSDHAPEGDNPNEGKFLAG